MKPLKRRSLVRVYWKIRSNARLLGELQPGDPPWMVTSGANPRHEAKRAGFLVAIREVKQVVANPDGRVPVRPIPGFG